MSLAAADFCAAFRREACHGVEYSFDALGNGHAVMISLDRGGFDRLEALLNGVPFAAEWLWGLQRYVAVVAPDAFLARADVRDQLVGALTLYCRFPNPPNDQEFCTFLKTVWPLEWNGPSPSRIAAAVGLQGPRGVGFRVDAGGNRYCAVYFRLPEHHRLGGHAWLRALAHACDLPSHVTDQIESDLRPLYPGGPHGIIGLDSASAGGALKLNPANVPVVRALAFLEAKGAQLGRLRELQSWAHWLRASWLSYLGVKYRPNGFAGSRCYLTCALDNLPVPLGPRISFECPAQPTLRLPHY
jgi:hypothetical protein